MWIGRLVRLKTRPASLLPAQIPKVGLQPMSTSQWVNVDYQTIVFQWKSYETGSGVDDTIPIGLVFRSDADDPTTGHGTTVWTKQLQMGKIYQFGIVINTTPSMTGEHVQKISGNFFPTPGYANPKLGLYGGKNNLADDSYVYNFIVGTELADIADVAGISV
ncbi:hypothetical protein GQ53DRAFT_762058 [Thozetella sp. PMI_491]|nr:hypothetical protein GQ53DRAFT_762058 [Thozetella sp. PMI_491]